MTPGTKQIPVLITTDNTKRGVFFAYIDPADADKDTITASNIQMCLYWGTSMKGVLGLASMGPDSTCRVSEPVERGVIKGVTFVAEVSTKAVSNWKKMPWSK